jgi:surfeit locus 1 family protein
MDSSVEMPRIGRLGAGFKSFRPPATLTLFLLLLAVLFASLGSWQTKRAMEKQTMEEQHQQALELPLKTAISQKSRFSRISVNGFYDRNRHFLLDNQIWQGRAGVYVFTPFYTTNDNVILVNRGWLPLPPDRKTLPEIPTPEDEIILKGILNTLPVPGKMLGSADKLEQNNWPQLLTYMQLDDLSASLQQPLENWIVQLSQSAPTGFEGRDWKPVFLSSDRHRAYAFQWFALTIAAMIMWLYIGFRNPAGTKQ